MSRHTITTEVLRDIPLFDNFNATDLAQIIDISSVIDFPPDQLIVEQGATSRDLYVLIDGRCEVIRRANPQDPNTKRVTLARLDSPAHFGDMSFFNPSPHTADVHAQTAVQVIQIEHASYDDLIRDGVLAAYKLAYNVTGALVRRLRRMDDWVTELAATDQDPCGPPRPEWQNFREKLFDRWTIV